MSLIDRGKETSGFAVFEERVSQLIRQNSSIPLGEVMRLLIRADADPQCDVTKEFRKLVKKYCQSPKTPSPS